MSHLTQHFLSALIGASAVMALQGCKVSEGAAAPAPDSALPMTYIENSVLTSRAHAALIPPPVRNSTNINVETHQGTVLLSGTAAADPIQMDVAAFIAQTVPGVVSVRQYMVPEDTAASEASKPAALRSVGDNDRRRAASLDAPIATTGKPSISGEHPPVALGHPLPAETAPFRYVTPTQSCWATFAHSVLGIRSIQDELLIKR